jgi:hypothetical protein
MEDGGRANLLMSRVEGRVSLRPVGLPPALYAPASAGASRHREETGASGSHHWRGPENLSLPLRLGVLGVTPSAGTPVDSWFVPGPGVP